MQKKRTLITLITMIFLMAACVLPDASSTNGSEIPAAEAQVSQSTSEGSTINIEPASATATAAAVATISGTEVPGFPPLKPPDADSPAAGICTDPPKGEFVVMTIRTDVPDPRCAKARRDQQLVLVNDTLQPIQASLGIFNATIQPGEEGRLDQALGEYLAPGVHFIQITSPGVGGELWLLDN